MKNEEAWKIYQTGLKAGELSDEDQFMVDEALDFLFRNASPGEEAIMAYNQAANYYRQGKKLLALKYYEYGAINYGDNLCRAEAGSMYFYGDGVPVDYEKAFRYLSEAHKNRWYRKSNLLAVMYENGIYVEKNHEKAQEIYSPYYSYRILNGT